MFQCHICGSTEYRDGTAQEILMIEGHPILVENIPAIICVRCGESIFSRETTEKIRQMIHGNAQPVKSMTMNVYEYVP
ncbi:MAG: YgiT-type zinc finger protein [Candidatus Omnitrophota bacterium]